MKTPILFEMETSDPDDFLTLLWLADHPDVDLLGVLITPGSQDQYQLVQWGLDRCGREKTPIGLLHGTSWWNTSDGQKPRVSAFHYKVYDGERIIATRIIKDEIWFGPDLVHHFLRDADLGITYLVGSPPKNLGRAFDIYGGLRLARWIQQGGFAGDNLVPLEHRLEKFKGKLTCPSFNPGGAHRETLKLLANDRIRRRLFVSKNVCHGVTWDAVQQARLKRQLLKAWYKPTKAELAADRSPPPPPADWMVALRPGLRTMIWGLDCYLRDKGVAKAMHDLVAAACALDESVCTFREVKIYREKGEWGANAADGTGTFISIAHDPVRFMEVLAR